MVETACGFCGEKRKITNEHVFGAWVGRLFGADPDKKEMNVRNALGREGLEATKWDAYSLDHKARIACWKCNSGWMSNLEDAVSAIISPMAFGNRRALSHRDQVVLATWAVKTAMVQEFIHSRRRYFSEDERRAMVKIAVPPQMGARVWAARYLVHNYGIHGLSSALVAIDNTISSHLSTFAIGQFIIQVLVERQTANDPERPSIRPGPWPTALIQVWPPSGFSDIERSGPTWPPRTAVATEDGFDALFDRFMAAGVSRQRWRPFA